MAKKFMDTNGFEVDYELLGFPPSTFEYKKSMCHHLGKSNKTDLMDLLRLDCTDGDEIDEALLNAEISQEIYYNDSLGLMDVCVRLKDKRKVIVLIVRSREIPPKPRKKRDDK